ncbi:MAG: hypothetical protein JW874_07055 [Spirochaetales bacterium]|nr:hypothetical protein [Spirochaetales bacterium]
MEIDSMVKRYRKRKIAGPDDFTVRFSYKKKDIQKIIPHRDPFLLVDELCGYNPAEEMIYAKSYIDPGLDLFKGHFPAYPVYPGCLEIEMTGQLGLCMYYFIANRTNEIRDGFSIPDIRATKVHAAHYLAPVLPGKTVEIFAKKLKSDEYLATIIGQIITDDTIACVAVSEVCFL